MINEKKTKIYCCEDISKIENYEAALADEARTWHIHHRKEDQFSRKELIDRGLYYGRPADELVFLTHSAHSRLHRLGKSYWLGRHHSEASKQKSSGSHRKTPVRQYSLDGRLLATFPSTAEAMRRTGVHQSNIVACCKGRYKSVGGYRWEYVA